MIICSLAESLGSGGKCHCEMHFAQGSVAFVGLEGEGQEHPESRRCSGSGTALPTVPPRGHRKVLKILLMMQNTSGRE